MKNNYNRIAPFYDTLVRFAFGDCQKKAQTYYLSQIDESAKILVVGGGSGHFIPELFRLKPAIEIDYLEPAPKMIALAKKQLSSNASNQINFIEQKLEDVALTDQDYDCILTFFFFDIFKPKKSAQLHAKLLPSLKENGKWLMADFNPPQKLHQKLWIKLMFLFLHFSVRADQKSIYHYNTLFSKHSFSLEQSEEFCKKLFFSSVYRKRT